MRRFSTDLLAIFRGSPRAARLDGAHRPDAAPRADDAIEAVRDGSGSDGLGRQPSPHRRFEFLGGFIHFFSYHLILARQSTRVTRAAGFRLTVRPTVFHPRYFISSESFARFIDNLDLSGKRVVDIGTGSGILALAAARAGAESVIATDINPHAALAAADNARRNGVGDRVIAVCADLLSALAPRPLFDVILSSPPKHAGEPRDLADRGWHAGPNYRDIAALFDQSRERLKPAGRVYFMVSSHSDLPLLNRLIDRAGFTARPVHKQSLFIDSLVIYELLPRQQVVSHGISNRERRSFGLAEQLRREAW